MTGAAPRRRLFMIGLCVVLMATAVYLGGESIRQAQRAPDVVGVAAESAAPSQLSEEVSGFARQQQALAYLRAPAAGQRDLETFYRRRAYAGAPPFIPHPVADQQDMGGDLCLTCHADGGYAPRFEAYTPVTPHPDLVNCRQCHVTLQTDDLFDRSTFEPREAPRMTGGALPGSPPPIPHGLQLRENCLACHAGPGAVAEIRVSHPERVNCRQCHVLDAGVPDFSRGDGLGRGDTEFSPWSRMEEGR